MDLLFVLHYKSALENLFPYKYFLELGKLSCSGYSSFGAIIVLNIIPKGSNYIKTVLLNGLHFYAKLCFRNSDYCKATTGSPTDCLFSCGYFAFLLSCSACNGLSQFSRCIYHAQA